jgi:zinc protease
MKHSMLLLAMLLASCGTAAPVPDAASTEELVTLQIPELSAVPADAIENSGVEAFDVDGLRVIVKRIPGRPVVSVRMYIAGGMATADPATAGVESLALVVGTAGGTESTPRDEFKATLDSMGSSISGSAGRDFSSISAGSVRAYFEPTWALFAQVLTEPSFDAKEFELVKSRTLERIRSRLDDPESALKRAAQDVFFSGHPYGLEVAGELETVEPLTRDQIVSHYKGILTRERLTLVVVGDVTPSEIEAAVRADLASLPRGEFKPVFPPELLVGNADVNVVEKSLPTNYLLGYYTAPAPTHPDYFPLRVATAILGDRLFEEVRSKRNLTYAVAAGLGSRQRNYGYLYTTAVDPVTTVGVMYAEVERLQNEPIAKEELQEQMNVFLTEFYLQRETAGAQVESLGASELVGGGWEQTLVFIDRVRAVTPEDVQRVSAAYMKNIHWGYVGDPAKADEALLKSR